MKNWIASQMCWTSIRYQILDGTTKFLLLKVLTIEHWQDIELARSVFDWRISAASKVSLPSVTEYFYNLNVAFIKAHCQRNSLYSIQAPFFILKVLWVSSCQELHHILALEELRKFHYHQWRVPRHAVNFISRNPPNVFKRSLHCESIVFCCQKLHHILALKELRRFHYHQSLNISTTWTWLSLRHIVKETLSIAFRHHFSSWKCCECLPAKNYTTFLHLRSSESFTIISEEFHGTQ